MLRLALLAASVASLGAVPDWVASGKWNGCPPSRCWVGVGSSEQSADKARQAAIADIAHQVSVRVKSDTRNLLTEDGGKADESSSARSVLKADERLEGVRIVESAQDGGTWYALAILERSALAAPGRAEMEKAAAEASDRIPRVRAALAESRVQEAVDELSSIERARRRFTDGQKSASLGEPDALREEFPLSQPVRDSFQREIVSGLRIQAPDTIRAGGARTVVPVAVSWRGTPVGDLDLELSGRDGSVVSEARSGPDGRALFVVQQLRAQPLAIRARSSSLSSVTRSLTAAKAGGDHPFRLVLDATSSGWRKEITDALVRSGWRLEDRGSALTVSLKTEKQGEISGFSGTLVRMRVQLTFQVSGSESSCSSIHADSDPDAAVKAAIRKLDCPEP